MAKETQAPYNQTLLTMFSPIVSSLMKCIFLSIIGNTYRREYFMGPIIYERLSSVIPKVAPEMM
jgi:hypothetical protein